MRLRNFVTGVLRKEIKAGEGRMRVRQPIFHPIPGGGNDPGNPFSPDQIDAIDFFPQRQTGAYLFPNPRGERAYALLLDDPKGPSTFEIIAYTRREIPERHQPDNFVRVELHDVERGLFGTDDQDWPEGTQITLDLPEKYARLLALQERQVFIHSFDGSTICKFDPQGEEVWSMNVGNPITDIASDLDGNVYAAVDPGSNPRQIKKYDRNGVEIIEGWPFDFNSPGNALVVGGDGYIYLNRLNLFIVKISPDGEEIWKSLATSLEYVGLAVNPDGFSMSVTNVMGLSEIYLLDPEGNLVQTNGVMTTLVRMDHFGDYYTTASGVVRKHSPNGAQLWTFSDTFGVVNAMAIDNERRRLYFIGAADQQIRALDFDGNEITGENWPVAINQIATGLEVDFQGNVYAVGQGNIWKFTSAGKDVYRQGVIHDLAGLSITPLSTSLMAKYGDDFVLGPVRWSEVHGALQERGTLYLVDDGEPGTPPAGDALLYLDDGELAMKFDNGAVVPIADNK